jgi:hypothetical protein
LPPDGVVVNGAGQILEQVVDGEPGIRWRSPKMDQEMGDKSGRVWGPGGGEAANLTPRPPSPGGKGGRSFAGEEG